MKSWIVLTGMQIIHFQAEFSFFILGSAFFSRLFCFFPFPPVVIMTPFRWLIDMAAQSETVA